MDETTELAKAALHWKEAFGVGVIGSFVIYFAFYRNTRLKRVFDATTKNWQYLVFDIIGFLACGGLVTVFALEPCTTQQAFMGGAGWTGAVGGLVAGLENTALREFVEGGPGKWVLLGS